MRNSRNYFAMITVRVVIIFICCFVQVASFCQNAEKIFFDSSGDKTDYYIAVRPAPKAIKGAIVLLTSFLPPENLLTETKLQNVAYANNLLTIMAPMKQKLFADSFAVHRISELLSDISSRFDVDTSKFVLVGYDDCGMIALRYVELTHEHPGNYPVQPKAVAGVNSHVDLFGLWNWAENQIKKNYWPGAVGDAKFYLSAMTKEIGTIREHADTYRFLSPFCRGDEAPGHEQYLKNVPVRLYYDMDINWQLQNRRNSLYDTKMPDGSELIKRLLLSGNDQAEFVASKSPGMISNGVRNPNSLSIVDEVEFVQWVKQSLKVFDVNTWKPPYELKTLPGWSVERFSMPPEFAPDIRFPGIEDVRFAPGWGDVQSPEHWTYAFLWWLDGDIKMNVDTLQIILKKYYGGLVDRNIVSRKIPKEKIIATKVDLRSLRPDANDFETFSGTVRMLDYLAQVPMTLHCLIHVKPKTNGHTAVFFEISPAPSSGEVWKKLDEIGNGFRAFNE
jgi:hypothetical protein